MKKIGFRLDVDGDWPPFDVEYLWVELVHGGYKIKNSPFFVRDIALDDIVAANLDEDNVANNWNLLSKSGNSTAWVFVRRKRSDVIDRLIDQGCIAEGQPVHNLYSVTIPRLMNIQVFDKILSPYKKNRAASVAFPAFRHADG